MSTSLTNGQTFMQTFKQLKFKIAIFNAQLEKTIEWTHVLIKPKKKRIKKYICYMLNSLVQIENDTNFMVQTRKKYQ